MRTNGIILNLYLKVENMLFLYISKNLDCLVISPLFVKDILYGLSLHRMNCKILIQFAI